MEEYLNTYQQTPLQNKHMSLVKFCILKCVDADYTYML